MTATPWDLLLDARTGIITQAERYVGPPEWPADFSLVSTEVADIGRFRDWRADRVSTGTAFGSPDAALHSALGEAVERYCGNRVPAALPRASHRELRAAGRRAVDPADLRLYSAEQYATPGFPFEPFTADTAVRWATGTDLVTGQPTDVPASLVWVNWFDGPRLHEPLTNFVSFAGIAAGPDVTAARTAALEEVVERDAVELWWDSGEPARRVRLPDQLAAGLTTGAGTQQLEYVVLEVPGPWRVPVVAVVVRDPELELVALGSAARPSTADAVAKAVGEAVSLRSLAKGMLDPDGGPATAVRAGLVDGTALKPWRADRAYLDSYAPDFSDVTDLLCQAQIHLDPRTRAWTDPLFTEGAEVDLAELAAARDLAVPDLGGHYRDECVRVGGHHPVAVDLTTPDVAETGLAVVRVVAPGTYGNAPAGFQFRDPTRRSNRRREPLPHT